MKQAIAYIVAAFACFMAAAQVTVDYSAGVIVNAGSGEFAPYYIASNNDGIITQSGSGLLRAGAFIRMDSTARFSFGAGVDLLGGIASKTEYSTDNGQVMLRPSSFFIQQLYAEMKYRILFLSVGMKQRRSALFNSLLGSGDFIEGNNARPVPQVRLGFIDFADIPLINGWVQIQGEYSFGKMMDKNWLNEHFNTKQNLCLTTDSYLSYKRLYFRTKPEMPFSVTLGMQNAVQVGGKYKYVYYGFVSQPEVEKLPITFKTILHTIIPSSGDSPGNDVYYDGNTIGSWDFVARYRLQNDDEIKAYFQWPFEDGSGIGKLNGFDGIYGVEYKSAEPALVSGVVLEYVDFRNQSGPMHFASGFYDVPNKPGEATGADDYYNNFQYNSYQNYGMSLGTPFIKSPIYNTDGQIRISDNRVRGFHVGVSGSATEHIDYRLLFSYRYSLGTPFVPRIEKATDTSMLLEATYHDLFVEGLNLNARVAFDRGSLFGDNFGALIGINYSGNFSFGK